MNRYGKIYVSMMMGVFFVACGHVSLPNLSVPGVQVSREGVVFYSVEIGESFTDISEKVGVSLETLFELNQLDEQSFIYPGMFITIGQLNPGNAQSYLATEAAYWYIQNPNNIEVLAIERLEIEFVEVMMRPSIAVRIYGAYLDTCTVIEKNEDTFTHVRDGNTFYIRINPTRFPNQICDGDPEKFFRGTSLYFEQLAAGEYVIDVNGIIQQTFTVSKEQAFNGAEKAEVLHVVDVVKANIKEGWGVDAVDILSLNKMEFTVPCDDGSCIDKVEPGYIVIARDAEKIWEYHISQDGNQIFEIVADTIK